MKYILKIIGISILLTSGIYGLFLTEITPLFSQFRQEIFAYIVPQLKPYLIMTIFAICFLAIKLFIPE